MKAKTLKSLGLVAGLALSAAPLSVLAAPGGTLAGTDVTNSVSATYTVQGSGTIDVGGAGHTVDATFKVDAKLHTTVTNDGISGGAPIPGEQVPVKHTLDNKSNTDAYVNLTTPPAGSAGPGTGWTDYPTSGVYTDDTCTTSVTNPVLVPKDGDLEVYVCVTIPVDAANGEQVPVAITTTQTDASGNPVVVDPAEAAEDKNDPANLGKQYTVLADDDDGANDIAPGDPSSPGDGTTSTGPDDPSTTPPGDPGVTVTNADVDVSKVVEVLEDPVNGTTNPRAIPGATVQYTVTVTNKANADADADALTIADTLPGEIDFVLADSGLTVDGVDCTSGSCTVDGKAVTATLASGVLTVSGFSLAHGAADVSIAIVYQGTVK